MQTLTFRAIHEDVPGEAIRSLFNEYWSAYRVWFLKQGDAARPGYLQSRRALRTYMPELVPLYDKLVELVGGSDMAARFLALYCPTPFLAGCSQAIWNHKPYALVRNYDYAPNFFDGVILHTNWHGTRVISVADCLWGALDGMNEHGLAASLAFGGRQIVGKGFGVTLVMRYVLEFCKTVTEAIAVFSRVPVHISYNIALLDKHGNYATVYVAPDRATVAEQTRVSTNHQRTVEWDSHARMWDTVERQALLAAALSDAFMTREELVQKFLRPPVYRYPSPVSRTLYTACYLPERGAVEYHWRSDVWTQSFAHFQPGKRVIWLSDPDTTTPAYLHANEIIQAATEIGSPIPRAQQPPPLDVFG